MMTFPWISHCCDVIILKIDARGCEFDHAINHYIDDIIKRFLLKDKEIIIVKNIMKGEIQ